MHRILKRKTLLLGGALLVGTITFASFAQVQYQTTAANVVALFTGCSGTMYLGADSACHSSSGGNPIGGVNSQTASYLAVSGDDGKLIAMNCSACTLTLPASPPSSTWKIFVQNLNATILTVARNGLNIDGVAQNLFVWTATGQNIGLYITTDGTNYFTNRSLNDYLTPNSPPQSPNAANDEFNASTLNTGLWTFTNQGSATETQASGFATITDGTSDASHAFMRGICQSLPTAPWTFVAKIAGPATTQSANFVYSGMYLRESATNKNTIFGFSMSAAAYIFAMNAFTDNATSFGANLFAQNSPPNATQGFFQISRSGTTLNYSVSPDGVSYSLIISNSITTNFTTAPDTICLGVTPFSQGATLDADFFRRTQ